MEFFAAMMEIGRIRDWTTIWAARLDNIQTGELVGDHLKG